MSEAAKWYVIHTYSGYENKVAQNIEKVVENRKLQHLIQDLSMIWQRKGILWRQNRWRSGSSPEENPPLRNRRVFLQDLWRPESGLWRLSANRRAAPTGI